MLMGAGSVENKKKRGILEMIPGNVTQIVTFKE